MGIHWFPLISVDLRFVLVSTRTNKQTSAFMCDAVCSFTSLLSLASNFRVISSALEAMATEQHRTCTARTRGFASGRMPQTEQYTVR